eukprot:TRINITY_DN172_c1_g1_i2.p1 TRINITY_DN172_c1_g1~~TRINITY_DN172_c1_g1_i2.p1  ORF type:complete len:678 (-),score=232.90 TRINITY_DN172_c1_g1_i2:465-2498(-)
MAAMRRLALSLALAMGAAGTASPISRVLELLGGMEDKIKKQGMEADEAMKEAGEFCRQRSRDLGYSIKTSTDEKEDLEAKISKSTSKLESIASTLQETSQGIETNEAELSKATEVREKEKADFATSEQDLLDTMDSMTRALGVLEKEAAKGKSESLLQVQQAPNVLFALEAMVSKSLISTADRDGLTAFLQNSEQQAPAVPAYEPKSGGVTDMLRDLQDKAKTELYSLRAKEAQAKSDYQMLRQSLEDEIKYAKEKVAQMQAAQAEESSDKASNEKDLKESTTNFAEDSKELVELTAECKRKKEDYEEESKEHADELQALGTAKDALIKKTGAAEAQAYSFLQLGQESSAGYPGKKVVQMLRDAARRTDSTGISLLARQVSNLIREGEAQPAQKKDVFASIKTLISNMISSKEKSLLEDTSRAAQCKKDMKVAKEKVEAKTSEFHKYQNKIDKLVSKSAGLKAEVSELQQALSTLAEAKANATAIRKKESAIFKKTEPELQQGLEGVKIALKVLRDYYGEQGAGAATGIIGMLEVVDSDFTKNLAEIRVAEKTAAEDYEEDEKEMKLETTRKEQDLKYKTQAYQRLDADVTEVQGDADSVQSVLDDAKQYAETVKAKCTVTPESYEEKKAARQQEIDDLKAALAALDSSSAASFIQLRETSAPRQLRGSHAANTMDN